MKEFIVCPECGSRCLISCEKCKCGYQFNDVKNLQSEAYHMLKRNAIPWIISLIVLVVSLLILDAYGYLDIVESWLVNVILLSGIFLIYLPIRLLLGSTKYLSVLSKKTGLIISIVWIPFTILMMFGFSIYSDLLECRRFLSCDFDYYLGFVFVAIVIFVSLLLILCRLKVKSVIEKVLLSCTIFFYLVLIILSIIVNQ